MAPTEGLSSATPTPLPDPLTNTSTGIIVGFSILFIAVLAALGVFATRRSFSARHSSRPKSPVASPILLDRAPSTGGAASSNSTTDNLNDSDRPPAYEAARVYGNPYQRVPRDDDDGDFVPYRPPPRSHEPAVEPRNGSLHSPSPPPAESFISRLAHPDTTGERLPSLGAKADHPNARLMDMWRQRQRVQGVPLAELTDKGEGSKPLTTRSARGGVGPGKGARY